MNDTLVNVWSNMLRAGRSTRPSMAQSQIHPAQ